jgi:hypothetical protein
MTITTRMTSAVIALSKSRTAPHTPDHYSSDGVPAL